MENQETPAILGTIYRSKTNTTKIQHRKVVVFM